MQAVNVWIGYGNSFRPDVLLNRSFMNFFDAHLIGTKPDNHSRHFHERFYAGLTDLRLPKSLVSSLEWLLPTLESAKQTSLAP